MNIKDFIEITDLTPKQIRQVIDTATDMKANPKPYASALQGVRLAAFFEKPSTRTRITFDLAIKDLGGECTILNSQNTHIGTSESIHDTAKVLERFFGFITVRTFSHETIKEFSRHSSAHIINALSDWSHPCQALAGMLTFEEALSTKIDSLSLAWYGDFNNVLRSYMQLATRFPFKLVICTPESVADLSYVQKIQEQGARVAYEANPQQAASGADVIITDTWVSMGDDKNPQKVGIDAFSPYQVNEGIMKQAKPSAIFSHCLPAHREEEVTSQVMDSPQSIVFNEAENRYHTQKALIYWLYNQR